MPDFSLPEHFDLSEYFDTRTLTQAMLLEPQKAVLSRHLEGEQLHTRLQAGGNLVYEQTISFYVDRHTGLHLRGLCTCPVGFNCKHVAAALMNFEAQMLRESRAQSRQPKLSTSTEPEPDAATIVAHRMPCNPASVSPPLQAAQAKPAVVSPSFPRVLEDWLADFASMGSIAPASERNSQKVNRQLMYILTARGLQLMLSLHLGSLRKGGQISSHRPHSPSPIDILRTRPSYLSPIDDALLAAILPYATDSWYGMIRLQGPHAAAAVAQMARSGRAWFVVPASESGSAPVPSHSLNPPQLPKPPGEPLQWSDEPLAVQIVWRANEKGQWAPRWERAESAKNEIAVEPIAPSLTVLLLPQPHVFDPVSLTLQPAVLKDINLSASLLESLFRMPAVSTEVLPEMVLRLGRIRVSRGLSFPLPEEHAQKIHDVGSLPLQPVLRLITCPNMPSEMWLEGHQRPPPSGQPSRQAAIQIMFRYILPPRPQLAGRTLDYHFPVGGSESVFVEQPGLTATSSRLTCFKRETHEELNVIERVFHQLQLRPWSRVAGWALERLAALKAGLLQSVQSGPLPPALQEGQLIVVPLDRDQWPRFMSNSLPLLQAEGWAIERDPDFPYEMYDADDFEISLADEPGAGLHWFKVGLNVTVSGQSVELVPLLVGLVQAGWLTFEEAMRDPDGEVLIPWPYPDQPAPTNNGRLTLRRERLLRFPASRVAPLVSWLRSIFLQHGSPQNAELPRLSHYELGALESVSAGLRVSAPPSLVALMDQLGQIRTGASLPRVSVSSHVNAELRPYQLDGVTWMDFLRRSQFGGILADDMGLGKTLQTLTLLQGELDAERLDQPCLIVVPTSLLGNWKAEAQRFTPKLRLLVLHGKQRSQHFSDIGHAHVVVTSYPLVVRDAAVLASIEWHYLILDEAQRIKNSRSQAAAALKRLQARHRLCLSGTPIENHLGELWSLMDFVSPGLLGQEAQFRELYRTPIERRQDISQAESLARRVRPFILRRTKHEVARELPEKIETLLRVELDGPQRDLYETIRATMDKKLREVIAQQGLARSQIVVLDALLKLRQVCCDPRLFKGHQIPASPPDDFVSAKLELLLDLLPTLVEDGRRILVFSQFTEMLALIEPELQQRNMAYLKLTGETTDRAEMVAQFQEGKVPLFLISLKAGGVGLNLTAADTVILYDPWWNPAVEQQAIDRAYRIGQGKAVFVYKLVASGTVEEKMLELQARKAGLADGLLSGVASDASFTPQDFDELFKPLGA